MKNYRMAAIISFGFAGFFPPSIANAASYWRICLPECYVCRVDGGEADCYPEAIMARNPKQGNSVSQGTAGQFEKAKAAARTSGKMTGNAAKAAAIAKEAAAGAAPSLQQAGAGGRPPQALQVSKSAATEIEAILDKNRFGRETAGFLIQVLLDHEGGLFPGYKKGGGFCWNDDGTFYGDLPCPNTAAKSRATARRTPTPANRNLQVGTSVAKEIDAFLDRSTMSKETAGVLIRVLLNHQGGSFPGYRKGGGWCWNDDGTFYGPLPCPKKPKK